MNNIRHLVFKIYSNPQFARSVAKDLFPISISLKQGLFLAHLINHYKPNTVLELGFGYGLSSLWIQSAKHTPKKHIVVDQYGPSANTSIITQHLAFQPNFTIHKNTSSQYFTANLSHKKQKVDFVFIDADERFDGVMTDMYFVTKILKRNGVVVIRNIWNPSVRKALLFYIKNLPYRIEHIPKKEALFIRKVPFFGELLLRLRCRPHDLLVLKLVDQDKRPWNHFVPF